MKHKQKQLLEEETAIGRSDETEEKSTITLSTQTCIICNGTTNNYDVCSVCGNLCHKRCSVELNKGNNKITELRTILQRESQNS
jgi:hypothetical protein